MKTPSPAALAAKLQAAAKTAAAKAYSPYSGFRVGAAIWTDKGLFSGCNVENASYGLTNCAERTAVFSAVAAGARRLICVAVYTPTPHPTAPCGACRQVLYEFGGDTARLISCCDGIDTVDTTVGALLPGAFGPADLGVDPANYDAGAAGAAGASAGRKASAKRAKKAS
jgi:cytidine deaminase